ncbi:MAG: LPXTG cell wall anchor domain-containing protein, partial [Firmicutes bacterium]|nr:LPXTG cell wall anchor domain-containing protein [Bacillota bacterium]
IVKITDKDGSEVKFSYADIEAGVKLTKPVAISVNDELDEGDEIDITWQRDIVVPEDTKFPVTVEFAVDEKDQEKTVYIYHYDAEKKVWEVVGSGKGKTVTAKFDSLSPGAMVTRTDEAPNTGDASRMFLWAAMIVAAAAAGTAAMLTGRKRKED